MPPLRQINSVRNRGGWVNGPHFCDGSHAAVFRGASRRPQQKTHLQWFGQSAFKLTTPGGKVIIIDPWITGNPVTPPALKNLDNLGKVDLILVPMGMAIISETPWRYQRKTTLLFGAQQG